jgi:hypothetical protein
MCACFEKVCATVAYKKPGRVAVIMTGPGVHRCEATKFHMEAPNIRGSSV